MKHIYLLGILRASFGWLRLGRGHAPPCRVYRLEKLPRTPSFAIPLEQQADPVRLRGGQGIVRRNESKSAVSQAIANEGIDPS